MRMSVAPPNHPTSRVDERTADRPARHREAGLTSRWTNGVRRGWVVRGWPGIAVGLIALTIRLMLALHLGPFGGNAPNTCTPGPGPEGVCVAYDPSFGGRTVFNVVDSGHTLKMPGYDAQLLASAMTRTHVFGALANSPDYPDQQGFLVSEKVAITNTTSTPLEFDQGGQDVDLMLAPSGTATPFARPQVPYPSRAPGPQLDQQGSIPAGTTAIGWVSFVVPLWAQTRLNSPPTDLEFFRPDHEDQGYVGRIRLWDAATPAGRAAVQFHPPAQPAPTSTHIGRCTNTWTGAAHDNDYATPSNWSARRIPNSSDVACTPPGSVVDINATPASNPRAMLVEGTMCLRGMVPPPSGLTVGTPRGRTDLPRLPGSTSTAPPCPPGTGEGFLNTHHPGPSAPITQPPRTT